MKDSLFRAWLDFAWKLAVMALAAGVVLVVLGAVVIGPFVVLGVFTPWWVASPLGAAWLIASISAIFVVGAEVL